MSRSSRYFCWTSGRALSRRLSRNAVRSAIDMAFGSSGAAAAGFFFAVVFEGIAPAGGRRAVGGRGSYVPLRTLCSGRGRYVTGKFGVFLAPFTLERPGHGSESPQEAAQNPRRRERF